MRANAAMLQERIRSLVSLYIKAAFNSVEIFIGSIAANRLPGVSSWSRRSEPDSPCLISRPKRWHPKLLSAFVLKRDVQFNFVEGVRVLFARLEGPFRRPMLCC